MDSFHAVIISIQRYNRRPNTDAIHRELTKHCVSNISADDVETQIKRMTDNGILENRRAIIG